MTFKLVTRCVIVADVVAEGNEFLCQCQTPIYNNQHLPMMLTGVLTLGLVLASKPAA